MTDIEIIDQIVAAGGMGRRAASRKFEITVDKARRLCSEAKGIVRYKRRQGDAPPAPPAPPAGAVDAKQDWEIAGTQYDVTLDGEYVFSWPVSRNVPPATITREAVAHMIERYSHHGHGETAAQVAAQNGLQKWQFAAMMRALNVVKEGVPFTPEAVCEAVDAGTLVLLHDRFVALSTAKLEARSRAKVDRKIAADAAKWHNVDTSILAWAADACADLAAEIAHGAAEVVPHLGTFKPIESGTLVIGISDFHFGKLASAAYNGQGDYNQEIATRMLREAIADLVSKYPGRPERIVALLNGDNLHIDNLMGTTSRGTPQDCDGTPEEIVRGFMDLMLRLPGELTQYARRVVVVPSRGNHDDTISHALASALSVCYERDPHVTVEHADKIGAHKFFRVGGALFLLTHGDKRKHAPRDLALMMATQEPKWWAECAQRYAITGHRHHLSVTEDAGITHVILPTVAGEDRWHADNWPSVHNERIMGLHLDAEYRLSSTLYGYPKSK